MAISDTNGEIVIFAYSGKTMIGRVYGTNSDGSSLAPGSVYTASSIIGSMISSKPATLAENHYIILNPCQIEYKIIKAATGSAKLEWSLTPYFYKILHSRDSVTKTAEFAFPKSQVVLSNLRQSSIDEALVSAYKELCD